MRPQPNPLFRLLIWNWLAGAAAAVILVGGLVATDAMRIRHLIFASDNPVVPLAMLSIGFLVTLCSVAMGTAIMMLPSDDAPAPERGLRAPVTPAEPALLRVVASRRRG